MKPLPLKCSWGVLILIYHCYFNHHGNHGKPFFNYFIKLQLCLLLWNFRFESSVCHYSLESFLLTKFLAGQILVWKVVIQRDSSSLVSLTGKKGLTYPSSRAQHQIMLYKAAHICKLVGHEGSIFRIAWSSDGSKLISVSDDRRL